MADYFPLISRAVANMGDSTAEDRRALYERAKLALVSQLRNSDPPIAETDIAREQIALEEAIRRAELNRWEFLFTSVPTNIPGGVGSPANALAIL